MQPWGMYLLTSAPASRLPACTAMLVFATCVVTALCSAQTAQQYLNAACANEIRQQGSHSLWASTSERRAEGHVYIEKTVETVDGEVKDIISVDGHAPTGTDKAKNDKVLQGLLSSARLREDKHNRSLVERKDTATLMTALPHMFLLQDQGEHNGEETLAFKPDPAFQPQGFEQRAIHDMTGTVRVAKDGMRLAGIDAKVGQAVQFGYGVLGTLDQGGTVALERTQIAPGVWKTNHLKVDVNGRVALFKSYARREEETKGEWHPVPPDTTVLQALALLGVHP